MARLRARIRGQRAVLKGLQNLGNNIIQEVSKAEQNLAEDAAADARSKAPVSDGFLKQNIGSSGHDLEWTFYSNAPYSPYVEFGTKSRVNIPPALAEEAAKFRGKKLTSGGIKEFEKSLRSWMKRKGIPDEALYPIMASILRYGIFPQPFFGPAYGNMLAEAPRKLNAAVKRAIDKTD